ncbi:MAG TPA: hypothetical protein DCX06_07605 [Opitutae bacterium]|nr:hypothetical protein [Opitutae bacterium]
MLTKFLAPLLLAATALVFTACDGGRAQMEKKEANLLGVASYQDENYSPTGPATIAVHTDELYDRDNPSGKKVTLLWGLITLKDY